MTLDGSDYLLRLSELALSFAGFTAVVVALRRAELSDLHMHFVRISIEGGLAVAACGLFPAVFSLAGVATSTTWRLSSAAAAFVFSAYLIFVFRRSRRVAAGPIQFRVAVNYATSIMAILALWVNTVGLRFQPSAVPYALALTWFFVLGAWIFLQNLDLFFRQPPSR